MLVCLERSTTKRAVKSSSRVNAGGQMVLLDFELLGGRQVALPQAIETGQLFGILNIIEQ